jgi:hypothetical protein
MKICKNCGKESNDAGARLCTECGGELVEKGKAPGNIVDGIKDVITSIKDLFGNKNSTLRQEVMSNKIPLIACAGMLLLTIFINITASLIYSLGLSVLTFSNGIINLFSVLLYSLFVYSILKRSAAYTTVWLIIYTIGRVFTTLVSEISYYITNRIYMRIESIPIHILEIFIGFIWSILQMGIIWIAISLLNKFYEKNKIKV